MKLHFDYDEAAEALGISKSLLEHNIHRLPHRRVLGNNVRFTESDLREISDMHAVRPGQKAPQVEPTTLPTPAPQPIRDLKPRKASRQSA